MLNYLECPVNFIKKNELEEIYKKYKFTKIKKSAECLIVNPGVSCKINKNYLLCFPNIKIVGTPSTGINHIDTNFLKKKNIKLFSLLDDRKSLNLITASAEFTWLHIMNAVRKFNISIKNINNWRSNQNENKLRSHELFEKKIGIIGFGRIGQRLAKYAKSFGMDVYYYDPKVINKKAKKVSAIIDLKFCDIISINPSLNLSSKKLISKNIFKNFKKNLVIVNTSRGEVVDEKYILHLIKNKGYIYSCDVLENEQDIDKLRKSPIFKESKKNKNIIITPHVAGATCESQLKALKIILRICNRF